MSDAKPAQPETAPSYPFSHMAHTARNHFILHLFAAIYYLVHYLQRLAQEENKDAASVFDRFPFLGGYFAEMAPFLPQKLTWHEGLVWWESQIGRWEEAGDMHLPLLALRQIGEIGFAGRMALMTAGLVEEDSRFGALFAGCQANLERRPTLELAGRIVLNGAAGDGASDPWRICQPLLSAGLLQAANRDAPRAEWALRAPAMLWDIIRGETAAQPLPHCRYYPATAFGRLDDLILPDAFRQQVKRTPALLEQGQIQTIILRGTAGSERLAIMGAIARSLGRPMLVAEAGAAGQPEALDFLGPFCALSRALPVLVYDLAPGQMADGWPLDDYQGPAGVLMGLEGGLRDQALTQAITLTLPLAKAEERRRQWRAALGDHPVADLDEISDRFHLANGYIRQAAGAAIAYAALEQEAAVTTRHVRLACRALNRQLLDSLATRLEEEVSWERLVVSDLTAGRLRQLERRCRQRERLLDHLGVGFGQTTGRGARALFTGGSGVGKTLAARILAGQLEMDIYRVDLASVVNKYIGETEKNLSRLLSRAEELDVILLLDEGDALLGRRTEVRSANDRYANLETDYLLQRLEHYQGIILITTNTAENIDRAFQRRMDMVINFVAPQAEERRRIWRLHLPAGHQVDEVFLQETAIRCALTGGQIRNAALQATLLALESGRPVTSQILAQALQDEYQQAGGLYPLRPARIHNGGGVEAFLDAFADE